MNIITAQGVSIPPTPLLKHPFFGAAIFAAIWIKTRLNDGRNFFAGIIKLTRNLNVDARRHPFHEMSPGRIAIIVNVKFNVESARCNPLDIARKEKSYLAHLLRVWRSYSQRNIMYLVWRWEQYGHHSVRVTEEKKGKKSHNGAAMKSRVFVNKGSALSTGNDMTYDITRSNVLG